MRAWLWMAAATALIGAGISRPNDEVVLIIIGDNAGYLTPCGCVKPMTGGIHRRATAVKSLRETAARSVVIDVGGWVADVDRQSEIKVETLAEDAKALGTAAIRLSPDLASLGQGSLGAIGRLSSAAVVSASDQGDIGAIPYVLEEGFLITSLFEEELGAVSNRAVTEFLDLAKSFEAKPIVMTGLNIQDARELAKRYPEIAVVTYRSAGSPPDSIFVQGKTQLVTVGDNGKHVVGLKFATTGIRYSKNALDPGYADDLESSLIYARYQQRVRDEDLIAQLPRFESADYAGNKACMSCHDDAAKVWKDSAHGAALSTLEKGLQDRDPDCVGCHVVGLESVNGFVSREKTPDLADVGCESCHGPGKAHAMEPYKEKMPKAGLEMCMSCHNAQHSPGFDPEVYWKAIEH